MKKQSTIKCILSIAFVLFSLVIGSIPAAAEMYEYNWNRITVGKEYEFSGKNGDFISYRTSFIPNSYDFSIDCTINIHSNNASVTFWIYDEIAGMPINMKKCSVDGKTYTMNNITDGMWQDQKEKLHGFSYDNGIDGSCDSFSFFDVGTYNFKGVYTAPNNNTLGLMIHLNNDIDTKLTVNETSGKNTVIAPQLKYSFNNNQLKLIWGGDSTASKHQIYYSKDGGKTFRLYKTYSSKKTSVRMNLKKINGTYAFKVRSYKLINGKKVFSKFSSPIYIYY